ncbi:hypothetical protein ACHAQH_002465 [Verticillium albo-atrum]
MGDRPLGHWSLIQDYETVDVLADLRARGAVFDLVVDNVGRSSELYGASNEILKADGTFAQVGIDETMVISSLMTHLARQLRSIVFGRRFWYVNPSNTTEIFHRIGAWMAEGKVKAVVDGVYPWEDVPAAYARLRQGHAKGKIVVRVAQA